MYYVYRFLNSNHEVIYVGRTNNLKGRMSSHFGKAGHLPTDCYKAVTRVDYLEMENRVDMSIVELYFIGKYRPIYNVRDNCSDVSVEINELKYPWLKFEVDKVCGEQVAPVQSEKQVLERTIEDKNKEIKRLKTLLREKEDELFMSARHYREFKDKVEREAAESRHIIKDLLEAAEDSGRQAKKAFGLSEKFHSATMQAISQAEIWKSKYEALEEAHKNKPERKKMFRVI